MITAVTKNARRFGEVKDMPEGMTGVYQIGTTFQVAPDKIGVSLNIRCSGVKAIDLEVGSDIAILDDLEHPESATVIPFGRAEYTVNPIDQSEILLARYPKTVSFVPLGALLPDGTPHPAAGTGFAVGTVMGFPARRFRESSCPFEGLRDEDIFYGREIVQCSYDGKDFKVQPGKIFPVTGILPGALLAGGGMGRAISDGADGFFAPVNGEKNFTNPVQSHGSGLAHWRYIDRAWQVIDYQPVMEDRSFFNTISGFAGNFVEASVARVKDNSLLFTAREVGDQPFAPGPQEAERLTVFRSADNGKSWEKCFEVPHFHTLSPMNLGCAADGTAFVTANPQCIENTLGERPGSIVLRERMKLWPIKADFSGLEAPLMVRDCPAEFGKAPFGSYWRIDHPFTNVLRLKDGKWHTLVSFRLLEHNECDSDAPMTPVTGCYIEEVLTDGAVIPEWRFA